MAEITTYCTEIVEDGEKAKWVVNGISDEPYSEPTKLIKKGSLGSGAKWVQWQLNRHGASLVVDGNFGKASEAELIEFQKKSGLTADGICGPATRAVLKL